MSQALAAQLDLRLAWNRVLDDLGYRTFVEFPFEVEMIGLDLDGWLEELREEIRTDTYAPTSPLVCEVPKPKGAIRTGAHLSVKDRVVYFACVGACLGQLHAALKWAQRTVDFSYQLGASPDDERWLRGRLIGWKAFRNGSLRILEQGAYSNVAMTDITAYYDLIDIGTLMSDLRAIGSPEEAVAQIGRCLNRWAQTLGPGRGIPQGNSGSDLLAKLYLNSVDRNLGAEGFKHVRYVDDFRIFCHSRVEAQRALILLADLLRHRGLHLASDKLEVHTSDDARREIEGIVPVLRTVQNRLAARLVEALNLEKEDPYLDLADIDRILADNPDEAPIEVIQEAYQTYFIDSGHPFDKTLFHFLLRRLRSAQDPFASIHCVRVLEEHPYETRYVLQYWEGIGVAQEMLTVALLPFLQSERAVYDFQKYQVMNWVLRLNEEPPIGVVALARSLTFDAARPPYLRAVARQILGRYGNDADLERLLHSYDDVRDDLDRAGVILSLGRLERGRRNGFLARVEAETDLNHRAATLVRQGKI